MIIYHPYFKYTAIAIAAIIIPFICLIILKLILKFTNGRCRSLVCLNGKTAIVTGGSSGIGYETALLLASRGCKVILADREDATEAKDKIVSITSNTNIVTKILDLASIDSIRAFSKDINATEDRLDILINNATVGRASIKHTDDGLNTTMQINHFGPFLLTHLLTDLLKTSAPSRIIFVSSATAFFWNNLSLDNLNISKKSGLLQSSFIYGNSKLCNIISANGFADRLKEFGVTSNSLNPGLVQVDLSLKDWRTKKSLILRRFAYNIFLYLYGKTLEEGAQTTLALAVSKRLENVTGKHFWDCRTFFQPLKTWRKDFCDEIWGKSEELVQLKSQEKLSIIETIES